MKRVKMGHLDRFWRAGRGERSFSRLLSSVSHDVATNGRLRSISIAKKDGAWATLPPERRKLQDSSGSFDVCFVERGLDGEGDLFAFHKGKGLDPLASARLIQVGKEWNDDDIVALGAAESVAQCKGRVVGVGVERNDVSGGVVVYRGGERDIGGRVGDFMHSLGGLLNLEGWSVGEGVGVVGRGVVGEGSGVWGLGIGVGMLDRFSQLFRGDSVRNRSVVVSGVGCLGSVGLVELFVEAGVKVLASSRSPQGLAQLSDSIISPNLTVSSNTSSAVLDAPTDAVILLEPGTCKEWMQWADRFRAPIVLSPIACPSPEAIQLARSRNVLIDSTFLHPITASLTQFLSSTASSPLPHPHHPSILSPLLTHLSRLSDPSTTTPSSPFLSPSPPLSASRATCLASLIESRWWEVGDDVVGGQSWAKEVLEEIHLQWKPGQPIVPKEGRGKPTTRMRRQKRTDF